MNILSLLPVKKNDWYIQASVFDDQIIVFFFNPLTIAYFFKIFYNEDQAYIFIEELTND